MPECPILLVEPRGRWGIWKIIGPGEVRFALSGHAARRRAERWRAERRRQAATPRYGAVRLHDISDHREESTR